MFSRDGNQTTHRRKLISIALGLSCLLISHAFVPPIAADEKFENYEVRVIRPKYFTKTGRFEMGAQMSVVMNETFIYTFLATGLMTYHFSETLAIEGAGSFGISVEKEDKRILDDEFGIKTQIFETLYAMEAALQWTPIYGKWQLPNGRLIYFDTFLAVGGGLTGINWRYSKFCTPPPEGSTANPAPADQVKSYPTILIGGGQRFFVKRDMAIKWDIRNHSLMYSTIDGECDPENSSGGSGVHHNITMQIGASKFF